MAAAAPLPISMSEYLHTSYEPDRDYVDGIVELRKMGGPDHAAVQRELVDSIAEHSRQWGVRAIAQVRVQTSASHVRVADVVLLPEAAPDEKTIDTPPVAVIEILAPDDRVPHYEDRLEDYRRMGVKSVWVIDPKARKGFDASGEEWIETTDFAVPETPIQLDLASVFKATEKDRAR